MLDENSRYWFLATDHRGEIVARESAGNMDVRRIFRRFSKAAQVQILDQAEDREYFYSRPSWRSLWLLRYPKRPVGRLWAPRSKRAAPPVD